MSDPSHCLSLAFHCLFIAFHLPSDRMLAERSAILRAEREEVDRKRRAEREEVDRKRRAIEVYRFVAAAAAAAAALRQFLLPPLTAAPYICLDHRRNGGGLRRSDGSGRRTRRMHGGGWRRSGSGRRRQRCTFKVLLYLDLGFRPSDCQLTHRTLGRSGGGGRPSRDCAAGGGEGCSGDASGVVPFDSDSGHYCLRPSNWCVSCMFDRGRRPRRRPDWRRGAWDKLTASAD